MWARGILLGEAEETHSTQLTDTNPIWMTCSWLRFGW
jgi:hypothetical protein